MHVQYLYTLDFLEFEMIQLEQAIKGYKEICASRMAQGDQRARAQYAQMTRLQEKILTSKRAAHRNDGLPE